MVKKELLIIADYSQTNPLTLSDVCEICRVSSDIIHSLVQYEIVHPQGLEPKEWVFDLNELRRIQTALRLQRDLDINVAGIAIVLDLLDEMQKLNDEMKILEKHFLI